MKILKHTKHIFPLIFSISVIMSPFIGVHAAEPISLSRFHFVEVDYDGEVYDASSLSEGLFSVCASGHNSGYIDKDGKTAIDFTFSYAGSFADSLAPASVPYGKMGYIDKNGKFEIEPVFDSANEFSCGLALVSKDGKSGFIDKTGRFTDIIDNSEYTPITNFNNGVCWVENNEGMRAVYSSEGKFITGFDFVWSGEWSDGVCWASKDIGNDFNHISMGLIDLTGNFIIPPGKYTDAQSFSEGLCWVKKSRR